MGIEPGMLHQTGLGGTCDARNFSLGGVGTGCPPRAYRVLPSGLDRRFASGLAVERQAWIRDFRKSHGDSLIYFRHGIDE